MPKKIEVLAREVRVTRVNDQDDGDNPVFYPIEFDGIKRKAGIDRFIATASTQISGALRVGYLGRPEGASYASPGQRPGNRVHESFKALKGRPNRCSTQHRVR